MAQEKISDEELVGVTGGYKIDQDGIVDENTGTKYYCLKIGNTGIFKNYFLASGDNTCSSFERTHGTGKRCIYCAYLRSTR